MNENSSSVGLTFSHGLWVGAIPGPYGTIELVLDGSSEAPNEQQVAAIQTFLPHAGASIERARRRLRFAFLWRPVCFAVNNQNRIGIQFQHRVFDRRELIFADEN